MKNIKSALLVVFTCLSIAGFAQHEVKLNVPNALLYEFNVSYEYGLRDNLSLGAFTGYVYGFPDQSNDTRFFYLGPEVRYYVSERNGLDRFYFGFYSRLKTGYTQARFNESGFNSNTGEYLNFSQSEQQDYFKVAVGFTIGGKWITRDGFVFGVFGGIGRNLIANYDETAFVSHADQFDPNDYYTDTYTADIDSPYWDFRVGFNLGWRFGK